MIPHNTGVVLSGLLLLLAKTALPECTETGGTASTSAGTDASGKLNASSHASSCVNGSGSASASAKITTEVKNGIITADFRQVSVTLTDPNGNVQDLVKGFQFTKEERAEALRKTPQRVSDRDVVAFKGIAQAAISSGNPARLAEIMVLATLNKRDEYLERELTVFLSDKEMLGAILAADPTTEFVPAEDRQLSVEFAAGPQSQENSAPKPPKHDQHSPAHAQSSSASQATSVSSSTDNFIEETDALPAVDLTMGLPLDTSQVPSIDSLMDSNFPIGNHDPTFGFFTGAQNQGRRLTCSGCSPAHSYICAHCWPSNGCRKYHWCKRRRH